MTKRFVFMYSVKNLFRIVLCSFLLVALAQPVLAQESMKRVKIKDVASILMPEGFGPMTEADLNNKYETYRYPLAMYSDQGRMVDFGINRSFTTWQEGDILLVRDFYKASLFNMYTEVEIIQEEIREVNGRKYAIFEFVGRVKDEAKTFRNNKVVAKYIYIMYTIYEGNSIVVNFNAPEYVKEQWQPVAREMMESFKLF